MATHSPPKAISGPKEIVFCDFDGTITSVDVTDQILSQYAHPSWREVEQAWVRGLIGSHECLERQMALVETSEQELNHLIDSVALDTHFLEFYRFIQESRLPFYMLSDGFDYVIERVLRRSGVGIPLGNSSHYFASALRLEGRRLLVSFPHSAPPCEHGCATCKPRIIRRISRRFGVPRKRTIFIGDGLSDRFAVEKVDIIFAKRQLLAYCRERGIPCHPFETLAGVEAALSVMLETRKPEVEGAVAENEGVKGRRSRVRVAIES